MPAYDYQCQKCNILQEVQHGMHEAPLVFCLQCGTQSRKVITTFAYTRFCWHAPDRSRTGSDRMVIRSAQQGKPAGPLSDGSDTLQTNLGLTR